jgi:hypothetical protein
MGTMFPCILLGASPHSVSQADRLLLCRCVQALRPGVRSAIAAASGAAGDIQLQDGDTLKVGSLQIR